MHARKLLTIAGCIGLTVATFEAAAHANLGRDEPVVRPLVDQHGRPAPGNVVGKGDPRPRPVDAGSDR